MTDRVQRHGVGHTMTTKNRAMYFALDNGCLLISIQGSPHSLTAQETHRLLNLLYINRQDILEANEVAAHYVEHGGWTHTRKPSG